MKGLKITGAGKLESFETNDVFDSVSSAKVKITKALLSDHDAAMLANGQAGKEIVPGRFAVGVVSQAGANCFGLEKGNRVYINPDTACGACYNCTNGDDENCSDLRIAGENENGFLRDFAVIPCNNLFVLPDSVSDTDALYIDYISHAVSTFTRLEIKKGDHVVVIGANTFGVILSLLIIYYQAVPILIDSDAEKLAAAKSCGVYYTLSTDSDLIGDVSELTGGRMAERVVYIADCNLNTSIPINLASYAGQVAFAGYGNNRELTLNFSRAMRKQLIVRGVVTGYGNTATSINLIANKAIPLSRFYGEVIRESEAKERLEQMAENFASGKKNPEIIVDFIKF